MQLVATDLAVPERSSFGCVLRHFRLRSGSSQNALAKIVRINASYINRLEAGERGRPTDQVVLALARGMALTPADTDALLVSAGYVPTWLRYLGGEDPTVQALAALLTDDRLDDSDLAGARAIIETLCERYTRRERLPRAGTR